MRHNHKKKTPQVPHVPTSTPTSLKTPEEWKAHWKTQGQNWRIEPEISEQRQTELEKHRAIKPDEEKGIFCFDGVKLNRADVEWLLATHENGRGPVIWSDESQRDRIGLDLRGADLRSENENRSVNLTSLPLSRLNGGPRDPSLNDNQRTQACIHLEGANLNSAHLEGADLTNIFLADKNHIGPYLADIHWGETNLAVVDWSQIVLLRDEYQAIQKKNNQGQRKQKDIRLKQYRNAARANRQVAVALQGQGISEDASRFAYHAQVSQKAIFWFQMIQDSISLRTRISYLGSWLFSWLIFLIAGYGYKFGRSLLTYIAVICGFATAYYLLGIHDIGLHNIPGPHHLSLCMRRLLSA